MGKKICIWGDSIAYGAGDMELGGWVSRLTTYLRKQDRDHRVYNMSISGDISGEVLDRFKAEAEVRNPDIIVFAIGINDSQYLNKEKKVRVSNLDFKNNIKELISQAKYFTNKIIFLSCTPVDETKTNPIPWHINRNYNNNRIENNNKIIKDICKQNNLSYIDIYSEFLKQKDYKKLLHDGLHPNADGHKLMFEIIKEKLGL
ncbi:hypothetical protein KKH39_04090 [Patescibacteria group bacterium]|nr:hypothetical protein [Patescibacteria group bacterium]